MIERSSDSFPLVYIVVVNWNGWRDTICCLESVLRLTYPRYRVVVCDNDSADGSVAHIQAWAAGEECASLEGNHLARLITPSVPKPVPIGFVGPGNNVAAMPGRTKVTLISTGGNLFFAGGNNRGMMHALKDEDCSYVWLLNNDTVVEPDALTELMAVATKDPKIGMCGSVLRSFERPHEIITTGGRRYNPFTARSRPIQNGPMESKGNLLDYIEGASMLVRRNFIETIGLLEESYSIYFEELDWMERSKNQFQISLAPKSVVYHKEGASSGGASARYARSNLSERYLARNRILFTRRFHPLLLPFVLSATLASALHRLLIGKPAGTRAILGGLINGFTVKAAGGTGH